MRTWHGPGRTVCSRNGRLYTCGSVRQPAQHGTPWRLACTTYGVLKTLEDTHREELKQRWDAYVAQHAETHMIASNDVLGVVGRVNGALRKIHGLVKGLDMGPRNPGDSVDALRERIGDLWPSLVALREAMRRDLDLPGSPS